MVYVISDIQITKTSTKEPAKDAITSTGTYRMIDFRQLSSVTIAAAIL